eukprot:403370769
MDQIEKLTIRQLYRGILKSVKVYPSKNRDYMRQAILEDVNDWKQLTDDLEKRKAVKKMRMLYGHLLMYQMKMEEVTSDTSGEISKPMPFQDVNKKQDEDFVYF